MNKSKKMLMSGGLALCSLGALGLGVFAFYSDSVSQSATSTAGLVDITATSLNLTNPQNINPGDNAQDLTTGYRTGTSHDLSFNVANNGNKSVVTRNVIDLSVPFGTDANSSVASSANVDITKYFLLNSTNTELATKYYLVQDSASTPVKVVSSLGSYTGNKIVGIRYVITGDSLNGVGAAAEIEASNNGKTSTSYSYKLGMKKDTTESDVKPLTTFNIGVKVEAMQYRNTSNTDWQTVFENTLKVK